MSAKVGDTGTVTMATQGLDEPGKVAITIDGVPQTFIAYSPEPLPINTPVVVTGTSNLRTVTVAAVGTFGTNL
jgi:hypothetical protein